MCLIYVSNSINISVPCFPKKTPKVVHPEEMIEHKNVHRYDM